MKLINKIKLLFSKKDSYIDLSKFEVDREKLAGCPLCHEPSESEIKEGKVYLFKEDELCLKHLMSIQ